MEREPQPRVLAPWQVRLFGLGLVLLGALFAGFSWASLQRPEIAAECQYEYTTDPECKRSGIWAGLVFGALGLPFLLAPSRWIRARRGASGGSG